MHLHTFNSEMLHYRIPASETMKNKDHDYNGVTDLDNKDTDTQTETINPWHKIAHKMDRMSFMLFLCVTIIVWTLLFTYEPTYHGNPASMKDFSVTFS